MRCRNTLESINAPEGTCVALGYFDGVHLGHRVVIGSAVQEAQRRGCGSAVFTFAPPRQMQIKGKRLLTEAEKIRRIEALGVGEYVCPAFEAFCALSPEEFVRDVICGCFQAKAVFCGSDFTFGKNKAGSAEMLRSLCAPLGIEVNVLELVQQGTGAVSSSRIRSCLEEGKVEEANAMLYEPYCIDFPVRHGKKLGTVLGFPTINQIYPEDMLIPREGVYVTRVRIDGKWYAGATGLGTRPTLNGQGITCETFIPGFSGDIYGDCVTLRFGSYLWPTKRFDSLEELAAMVKNAAEASINWHEIR